MTFLCVITPVFDACLAAFKLLTEALREQTCSDFIHVAISNGESPSIQEWITSLYDPRFIYATLPAEPTPNLVALISNLGKRRNYCLKNYAAQRFVFLDADLKIIDNTYFQKLQDFHDSPVIITRVKNGLTIFPKFPIHRGRIDIANYSFNQEIAKKVDYPTDVDYFRYHYANDFRFYDRLGAYSYKIVPAICAIKDGNKGYTRLTDLF